MRRELENYFRIMIESNVLPLANTSNNTPTCAKIHSMQCEQTLLFPGMPVMNKANTENATLTRKRTFPFANTDILETTDCHLPLRKRLRVVKELDVSKCMNYDGLFCDKLRQKLNVNRKRRRVRIHEDHQVHPPSHHGILEDKTNLWYTQEDFALTLLSMRKVIQRVQCGLEDQTLPVYGETLASTYLACCADTESSSSAAIPRSITPMHLELLGVARGDNRGMETCALPDLAAERSQKRREIIQSIVFLGRNLKGAAASQTEECLRSVSEQLTAPSRKFAQAMGISDTLSALTAYAEDN